MSLCPTYHAPSSHYIIKQWLPAGFSFHQTIQIRVTTVVSPTSFWVQLEGPSYRDRLDDFETKMNAHYNSLPKEAVLFDTLTEIKDDVYVAILMNKKIRRARVHRLQVIGGRRIATVFHIDYGMTTKETCDTLMKLHRKFFYLPQQAIWATLANTVPPDGKLPWSIDDSTRFASMCKDKILEAKVVGVYRPKLKLHLVLNDVSKPPVEVNISDSLIENGIATYGETINLEPY